MDCNSKGNTDHKPGLHRQPELPGILYLLLRSPRSFSLLSAFTAFVERAETSGRVQTGKPKRRARVPAGPTRQEVGLSKHSEQASLPGPR